MSAIYLASLLLAAPPEAAAHSPLVAPPVVTTLDRPPSAAELRKAHSAALRQSHRVGVSEAVPELVRVFRLLEQDKQLTNTERADLRFKARSRLLALGDQIVSDARRQRAKQRQQEAAAKTPVRGPLEAPPVTVSSEEVVSSEVSSSIATSAGSGKPSDYAVAGSNKPQGRAGGLGQDEGEALVELIRSVIAPDSWDTAGGPGSMYYWKQWQVLVVRQTEEVHWLIGGFQAAMRK